MSTLVVAATDSEVTLNVALELPAVTATLAGTVATAVSALIRLIVTPPVGAAPVRFTVPIEPVPPVTAAGFKTRDVSVGGRTVSVPEMSKLDPVLADTIAEVAVATVVVMAVKVCMVLPAGMVTPAGTVTVGSELISDTNTPPAGATTLMVTVPVEVFPPVTFAGMKLTRTTGGGSTVRVCVTMVVPEVAVTVTRVELPTEFATTIKVWAMVPAATVILIGTATAAGLLLIRFTVIPPAGAFPVSVTVPVALCPLARLFGLNVNWDTAAGRIVSVLVLTLPLSEAESVAKTVAVTGTVGTPNTTLDAPAGIVAVVGTSALGLLLESCTVIPPVGAGPPMVTVILAV